MKEFVIKSDKKGNVQKSFDDLFMTGPQICKAAGIPKTTLKYAKDNGNMPAPVMRVDRNFVWDKEEVQEFIRQRLSGS